MKYYLDATGLTTISDLRSEVVDSIRSKNLPQAIKNDLQLSFNNWLDTRTEAMYKNGVELPGETPASTQPNTDGNFFSA
ncbi:hypothetical protein [Chamaesiphon sp. OTE_75_metabat_556]|uniref:hypothetical protein n=1 Tax=Chamaesiphon sp. OTE_75_metabat_556 TaxID=2964692 RepID=UPI00286CD122|nr:hypothetical protein [Chamaesiphon sp. OTE_75_metabat_556]